MISFRKSCCFLDGSDRLFFGQKYLVPYSKPQQKLQSKLIEILTKSFGPLRNCSKMKWFKLLNEGLMKPQKTFRKPLPRIGLFFLDLFNKSFLGVSCLFSFDTLVVYPAMTCKWLITMVIVSPLTGVVPLPNGQTHFMAFYKWG